MILNCRSGDLVYEIETELKIYRRTDWDDSNFDEWRGYDHLTPAIPEIGVALYIDHGDGSYRMTGLIDEIRHQAALP